MRWGDDGRLAAAISKLDALASLARHSQVPFSAITARICSLVAAEYNQSSVWAALARLGRDGADSLKAAYARFGRGAFLNKHSLVWASQEAGIERLREDASFVLCTPTGSGKTIVAELALIGDLFRDTDPEEIVLSDEGGPLALYLVPSRALASEVEARLSADLANVGKEPLIVTGLYGGTDWGPTDAWVTRSNPTVLVCTYEKAEALLRFLGPVFLQRVCAVVLDEAHSVQYDGKPDDLRVSESRALRLEVLAVRLLRALDGRKYRLIALSAVTAGVEGSLSRWLVGRSDATPAHSTYRSTRQLVGRLECLPGRAFKIYYDLLDRTSLAFGQPDDVPYVPQPFSPHPPSPSCEGGGPLVTLRPYLAWAALQLAKTDASGNRHSVLVSITSNITAYAKSFLTLIEDDWRSETLPEFFNPPVEADTLELWEQCLATAKDYFTEASPEYRLLCHGIVVHHGKMPALMARRLKTVIERGIVRVVLATSTLSEGVNLPVEYILLPDLHRSNDRLRSQEFLNLVGRAGRPGHGTEGRTLVLLPPDPGSRRRDRESFSKRRLRAAYWELIREITEDLASSSTTTSPASPLAQLLVMLHDEWAKVAHDGSAAAFDAWLESTPTDSTPTVPPPRTIECLDSLDAVLLPALEELEQLRTGAQLSATELEEALRRIWDVTYAKVASNIEASLARTFLRRGLAIPKLYPRRDERRRIYKTSMPPISARDLLALVDPIKAYLQSGAGYARMTSQERYAFVEGTLGLIAAMPRFAPAPKAGAAKVNWKDVLCWWLNPREATVRPKPDRIGLWHEYAARTFAYKANWALGSVIAICFDESDGSDQTPVALSLDDWPSSGLPWAAFWVKELLTWGTLEPVAAYLLARGGADTRQKAEADASEYYKRYWHETDANALLDPRRIRDWTDGLRVTQEADVGAREHLPQRVPVELVAVDGWRFDEVRVFPSRERADGTIEWLDIAGYHVASSAMIDGGRRWDLETHDFVLDVKRGEVTITTYP